MSYIFKTERLGFRQWRESDRALFRAMNADAEVMEFFVAPMTSEETDAMMKRMSEHLAEYGFGFYAVDLLATKAFMGFIGIGYPRFEIGFGRFLEIGWRTLPAFWGKGLATEGAKAVIEHAFEVLDFDCIYAMTTTDNIRSEKVMQKIGMVHDRDFDHPLLPGDSAVLRHVLYRIDRSR